MKKRIIFLLAVVYLFSGLHVFAAVGDAVHPLYATDIKTYIDG